MPSYRLIKLILQESEQKSSHPEINEDDFVFRCNLFRNPARMRSELKELERLGYISYPDCDSFIPCYPAYHWKRELFLRILRYIGHSIVTPILVTLATMWVTSHL